MRKLIMRPLSGLGNRLLALAGAAALVEGRKDWEVYYQWPIVPVNRKRPDHTWFPSHITEFWDVAIPEASEELIQEANYSQSRVTWGLNQTQKFKPLVLPEADFVVADGHGFCNINGDGRCLDLLHQVLIAKLTPLPEIRRDIEEFKKRYFVPEHTYAVQLRANGRHVAKWEPVKKLSGLIDQLLENDTEGKIFLSCEDRGTVNRLQQKHGSRICTVYKPARINTPEALRASVIDLYLLAAADRLYGTPGSGFSNLPWLLRSDYNRHDPFDIPQLSTKW